MATNLDLDDKLIEEARELGSFKTKKEAVSAALREFVQHRRQMKILELIGKVEYFPAYDYKAARRKR
jgi:Arc/MetJ family transcription regulator